MVNQFTRIYYLHKGDDVPFYIGKTVNTKNERLKAHRDILGKNIFLEDIDIIPTKEWKFWEKHYISLFKTWGFILENKNNGGGGCITHEVSQQTRTKIGKAHKGKLKPFSESHKLNLRKSLQNKKYLPSQGKKISEKLKGRKVTWKTGKSSKSIFQYSLENKLIKEWKHTSDAVKIYSNSIRNCAQGKQKTSHNFIWKYEKK